MKIIKKYINTSLAFLAIILISSFAFNAITSYHNRIGGYCDNVKTNSPQRIQYVDYQVFCK